MSWGMVWLELCMRNAEIKSYEMGTSYEVMEKIQARAEESLSYDSTHGEKGIKINNTLEKDK